MSATSENEAPILSACVALEQIRYIAAAYAGSSTSHRFYQAVNDMNTTLLIKSTFQHFFVGNGNVSREAFNETVAIYRK